LRQRLLDARVEPGNKSSEARTPNRAATSANRKGAACILITARLDPASSPEDGIDNLGGVQFLKLTDERDLLETLRGCFDLLSEALSNVFGNLGVRGLLETLSVNDEKRIRDDVVLYVDTNLQLPACGLGFAYHMLPVPKSTGIQVRNAKTAGFAALGRTLRN
jgi:hypothetical protein